MANEKTAEIVEALKANPDTSNEEVASSFGVTAEEVAELRAEVANTGDTPVEDGNTPAEAPAEEVAEETEVEVSEEEKVEVGVEAGLPQDEAERMAEDDGVQA